MWKYLGSILGGIALVILIGWGIYQFNRWWNYTWGYEGKVQQTVCDMVDHKYLKQPEKC